MLHRHQLDLHLSLPTIPRLQNDERHSGKHPYYCLLFTWGEDDAAGIEHFDSIDCTAPILSKDGVEPGYCPGPQAHDPLEPQIWFLCTLLVPEMEVEPMPLEGLR